MRTGSGFLPLVCLMLLGAALTPGAGAPAGETETGRPLLRHYAPGEHFRQIGSQRVTQDVTGLMVFGSQSELLYFDGARWRWTDMSGESAAVRQFTRTADGTIYVAGAGAIGFVRGAGRTAEFASLADRLPPGADNIDELRDAVAVGQTVYFSDDEKLLVWENGKFTAIPYPTPPGSHGTRLHRVGDTVYATALGRPLVRFTGRAAAIQTVADDPVLRENKIISIEAGEGDSLVLLTAERGFHRLRPDGRVESMPTPMNRWLQGRRVYCAMRLPDGSRVVGFSAVSGNRGVRFGPDGRYLGPLDTSIGLLVNEVRSFFVDSEGGLWIGMDTGAARLEWPSPVSLFDATNGLGQGRLVDVVRHAGVLYAATSEGLFRLVPEDADGRMAHFERVDGREFSSLVSHPHGLLALGVEGLFLLEKGKLAPLLSLRPGGGALLHSRLNPDRVWVGTPGGLQAVWHTAQGWIHEVVTPALNESCADLAESADGTLWMSTPDRGLFRVTPADGPGAVVRFERFTGGRGMPAAFRRVRLIELANDAAFLAEGDQVIRRYEAGTGAFVPVADGSMTVEEALGEPSAIAPGTAGAWWLAGPNGLRRLAPGQPTRLLPHMILAAVGSVARIWEENRDGGSVLWVGGDRGLARIDLSREFPAPTPFATQLGSMGVSAGAELPRRHEALTFNHVASRQQPGSDVVYQTRLVGLDEDWSEWSTRRERSFVNLSPGSYRFMVRARDADGQLTVPAELGFAVLPLWWASGWAIFGYAVAGTALIAGLVQFRTRALRRHAERLGAIVAERTAELERKNTELVRLNRLELDEKISARLAEEKARLEVLRYQLNPHFLFNTLASISAVLPGSDSPARQMVERLADFCRLTLHRTDERDWTTLGGEIHLLRAYLEIEQSRWGDLLDVELAHDPALDGEPLPHFLLLPLVENALKYGRATSVDRVGLRLTTRRGEAGALILEVANTGEWVEPTGQKTVSSLGIGLDNLRERLVRHYPRRHRLEIAAAHGWVTVTLHITTPAAE